jgi:Flp pilus assembly protein TadG
MTTPKARWVAFRAGRSPEGGYVAVMTGLLLMVLLGISAFAVDVGFWYVVGQQEQRAADAAALAGVTSLPGDITSAYAAAQNFSKINGFPNGVQATTVTPAIDGRPTRLRVTVTRTVDNLFGSLWGVPKTTISRTAVADYAGPVPLGSPCNEYGDDPDNTGQRSSNCNGVAQFWANVGSPQAPKGNGDAYQNDMATNTDFDPNGYFYTVTVRQAVANLRIEAFDPALIDVGDVCERSSLASAKNLNVSNTVVTDPSTRYKEGTSTAYCTGDIRYGGTGEVQTQFTVRSPGLNPWDPLSFPPIGGTCTQTFAGYTGDLSKALDRSNGAYTSRPDVARNFRQWKTLCNITNAQPGTYMIQVKTNNAGGLDALGNPVAGNDLASGHNRFSLRAYGASAAENDAISVAGYNKMAMYANTPNGTTTFFLAKVPTGARGQMFNVSLWDVGDGAKNGSTITVLPPSETGGTFSNCTGAGVKNGALTSCGISVDSTYNARWQTISVPIPPGYSCTDASATGCWVRLVFYYGSGSSPMDTTSWTASVVGDPVRLVE